MSVFIKSELVRKFIMLKHDILLVLVVFTTESNSARLIGMGGVPLLLTHHSDWHQADSKNRYITLRKAILNTLKNITNLSEYMLQHLCT